MPFIFVRTTEYPNDVCWSCTCYKYMKQIAKVFILQHNGKKSLRVINVIEQVGQPDL